MNEPCRIIKKIDNCPGYQNCPGFEWYDYGDIRWCGHQIMWIIQNSETLRIGEWPDPPSYIIDIVQSAMSTQASFVGAVSILAEVEARLKRTGKDGDWLVSLIKLDCPIDELPFLPKMAFHYITGWHRYGKNHEKWMPYSQWKKQKVYRNKRRTK